MFVLEALSEAKTPKRALKRLLKKILIRLSSLNYTQFQQRWTDSIASDNPRAIHFPLIGWEEAGYRQFLFLKNKGLKPHHKFLDLGCGTLALGNYLIKYLDKGNYIGMDISAEAFTNGRKLVEKRIGREKVKEKQPILIQNKDLTFSEVVGQVFDYVMVFSVFTLLPVEYFEEFILNIGKITNQESKIFLTIFLGKRTRALGFPIPFLRTTLKHEYDLDLLRKLLLLNDYTMEIIDTRKHWGNSLKERRVALLELSHR